MASDKSLICCLWALGANFGFCSDDKPMGQDQSLMCMKSGHSRGLCQTTVIKNNADAVTMLRVKTSKENFVLVRRSPLTRAGFSKGDPDSTSAPLNGGGGRGGGGRGRRFASMAPSPSVEISETEFPNVANRRTALLCDTHGATSEVGARSGMSHALRCPRSFGHRMFGFPFLGTPTRRGIRRGTGRR